MKNFIFAVFFAFHAVAATAAPRCDEDRQIFLNEDGGERVIFYHWEGANNWERYFRFETWRGKKHIWSFVGTWDCSTGAAICFLNIEPMNGHENDKVTHVAIETIDEDKDGNFEWYIFQC